MDFSPLLFDAVLEFAASVSTRFAVVRFIAWWSIPISIALVDVGPRELLPRLKPKPVLHVTGENDTLVKFAWQQRMMDGLRKLNQCGPGQPWEGEQGCTLYPSKLGEPVVTFIHPGPHVFPANAPAIIVKFFKQNSQP